MHEGNQVRYLKPSQLHGASEVMGLGEPTRTSTKSAQTLTTFQTRVLMAMDKRSPQSHLWRYEHKSSQQGDTCSPWRTRKDVSIEFKVTIITGRRPWALRSAFYDRIRKFRFKLHGLFLTPNIFHSLSVTKANLNAVNGWWTLRCKSILQHTAPGDLCPLAYHWHSKRRGSPGVGIFPHRPLLSTHIANQL